MQQNILFYMNPYKLPSSAGKVTISPRNTPEPKLVTTGGLQRTIMSPTEQKPKHVISGPTGPTVEDRRTLLMETFSCLVTIVAS